jgi:tetratricopeptide (TPR) repeat protein
LLKKGVSNPDLGLILEGTESRAMKCIHQLIMILGIVIALSQVCLGCRRNTRDDFSSRCIELIGVQGYQEALENCSQAILLGSNTATDYVRRGYVRTQLGEYDKAIEDYTQALFLQPNGLVIYNHRCVTYYLAGRYKEAIADCNQALSLKPDYAGAYASRGRVRVALKDKKGAIEDYQKAAKLFLKEGNKRNYQGVQEDLKKLQD